MHCSVLCRYQIFFLILNYTMLKVFWFRCVLAMMHDVFIYLNSVTKFNIFILEHGCCYGDLSSYLNGDTAIRGKLIKIKYFNTSITQQIWIPPVLKVLPST